MADKGRGSSPSLRIIYFLAVLSQTHINIGTRRACVCGARQGIPLRRKPYPPNPHMNAQRRCHLYHVAAVPASPGGGPCVEAMFPSGLQESDCIRAIQEDRSGCQRRTPRAFRCRFEIILDIGNLPANFKCRRLACASQTTAVASSCVCCTSNFQETSREPVIANRPQLKPPGLLFKRACCESL